MYKNIHTFIKTYAALKTKTFDRLQNGTTVEHSDWMLDFYCSSREVLFDVIILHTDFKCKQNRILIRLDVFKYLKKGDFYLI